MSGGTKVVFKKLPESMRTCTNFIFDHQMNDPLNVAIIINEIEEVELLIRNGVDVNKPGQGGWTPLHVAVEHGHHEIIILLIQNGADVSPTLTEPHELGFTPLHIAARLNHLKCAEVLLHYGASVSPKTEDIFHPINLAVFEDHVEMVELLVAYGGDVNLRFSNNFFKMSNYSIISDLWMDHDLPLLHYSILRKMNDMTDLLMNFGADIHSKTSLGKTTLMQAVEVDDYALVDMFLEEGANANARDYFGQPVLHFTIDNARRRRSLYSKADFDSRSDKLRVLHLLVSHGADVNARFPDDTDHSSVIHYMIRCGFSLGVIYLLNQSDLNWEDIGLETVHLAQIFGLPVYKEITSQFPTTDLLPSEWYTKIIDNQITKPRS